MCTVKMNDEAIVSSKRLLMQILSFARINKLQMHATFLTQIFRNEETRFLHNTQSSRTAPRLK